MVFITFFIPLNSRKDRVIKSYSALVPLHDSHANSFSSTQKRARDIFNQEYALGYIR